MPISKKQVILAAMSWIDHEAMNRGKEGHVPHRKWAEFSETQLLSIERFLYEIYTGGADAIPDEYIKRVLQENHR